MVEDLDEQLMVTQPECVILNTGPLSKLRIVIIVNKEHKLQYKLIAFEIHFIVGLHIPVKYLLLQL